MSQSRKRGLRKYVGWTIVATFCTLNLFAYVGAYAMTHSAELGASGLGLPKLPRAGRDRSAFPSEDSGPSAVGLSYTTHRIPIDKQQWLDAWFIPAIAEQTGRNGTVFLFPGNSGSKSTQLLAPAQSFHRLGYDTWLIDFRGVGDSSGDTTTLGYREAEDVAVALNYARQSNSTGPFILYGVSMGSVAVLKATAQEGIEPDAIILELPFATLKAAVASRLKDAKVPRFPMVELLVFWGSFQHGFNGFTHNPVDYAQQVTTPTLVLHGEQDKWTTLVEIEQILENLQGPHQLVLFPDVGHSLLVTVDKAFWEQRVDRFLREI